MICRVSTVERPRRGVAPEQKAKRGARTERRHGAERGRVGSVLAAVPFVFPAELIKLICFERSSLSLSVRLLKAVSNGDG